MRPRGLPITRVDEHVISLQVSADEAPHLGAWLVPALREASEVIAADASARVVVLEGGERYFSAGASRDDLVADDAARNVPSYAGDLPGLLLDLPLPSIAAMVGHAIGGGLLLGLWCDAAFLAEESLYGANFMALGFTPGMGATAVLEEVFGGPLGRELLYTGRTLKGREIKAVGGPLAGAVVPRTEVRARAIALAGEMARAPREALALLKVRVAERRREGLRAAVAFERRMHAALFSSAETRREIAERYGRGPAGGA